MGGPSWSREGTVGDERDVEKDAFGCQEEKAKGHVRKRGGNFGNQIFKTGWNGAEHG